jgi:hypothetical protein
MSRKASVFSDSKSFKEGISPAEGQLAATGPEGHGLTLDNLAEDAGHCGAQCDVRSGGCCNFSGSGLEVRAARWGG